jgi:hypothetical protein
MAESRHSTRRAFLKSAPLAAVAISLPAAGCINAAVAAPQETLEQEIDRLAEELHAAMKRLNGDGCLLVRNEYRCVAVCEPVRPRTVEFAGPGFYEVQISEKCRPIYHVERAPEFDFRTEKCFRLTPRDATHLGIHYNFESHLRTVLVRKI